VTTVPAIRRVLVATKHLKPDAAIDKAAHIADRCGAELVLFHDLDYPLFLGAPASRRDMRQTMRNERQRALAALERLALPLRARGLRVSTVAQWDYPPHEAVIRAASRARADLIVVPCRARHRLPAVLGYTDWSLLRESTVPVLLVKSPKRYTRPRILAAVDPTHAFAKPAALDDAILGTAVRLGTRLGAAPHLVHAYCPPVAVGPQDIAGTTLRLLDEQSHGTAKRAFRDLMRAHAIPAGRGHLVRAHPVDAIVRTAREIGASIVVMGAVSRRGLRRFFIGDTAERLLDELPCDLLVVKPARFGARVPPKRRGVRVLVDLPPMI